MLKQVQPLSMLRFDKFSQRAQIRVSVSGVASPILHWVKMTHAHAHIDLRTYPRYTHETVNTGGEPQNAQSRDMHPCFVFERSRVQFSAHTPAIRESSWFPSVPPGNQREKVKGKSYPCSRPWRPIGLWDVEAPTFSGQSAHRRRWSCQPYAPAALYPRGRFQVFISVRGWVDPRVIVLLVGLGKLKKSNNLIGNQTRNLPACSIVPQSRGEGSPN
jgi:hypothetical protein